MNTLLAFLKPFLKDKGLMLITDKGMWVAVLGVALQIVNKKIGLGLDDTVINSIVVGLAGWFVVHLAHQNTVNKEPKE